MQLKNQHLKRDYPARRKYFCAKFCTFLRGYFTYTKLAKRQTSSSNFAWAQARYSIVDCSGLWLECREWLKACVLAKGGNFNSECDAYKHVYSTYLDCLRCSLNIIFMQRNDMLSFINYLRNFCFAYYLTFFSVIKMSLGKVATLFRWGGIFNDSFIANVLYRVCQCACQYLMKLCIEWCRLIFHRHRVVYTCELDEWTTVLHELLRFTCISRHLPWV